MNTHSISQRSARAAACGALILALSGFAAMPASADETNEAIQLSWDGTEYAATTTETFLGTPVTVPGDHAERSLIVRNDGPSAGTLSALITRVTLLPASAGSDDSFYDDVLVGWGSDQASLSVLDSSDETQILTTSLDPGESTTITISYDFPVDSTSGNASAVGAREASFDVDLTLRDDTVPAGEDPPLRTEDDPPAAPAGETPPRAGLAATGGSPGFWIAVIGVLAVPTGLLLLRRRSASTGERLGIG